MRVTRGEGDASCVDEDTNFDAVSSFEGAFDPVLERVAGCWR